MIGQMNDLEVQNGVTSLAEQPMSSGQVKHAMDGPPGLIDGERPASRLVLEGNRPVSQRTLEAYIERRKRLAETIRAEHPSYTKAEIEERLEQFGA